MQRRRLLNPVWSKPITIDLETITPEMVDWYHAIGGHVNARFESVGYGKSEFRNYLSYGNGKWCNIGVNGTARLHFCAEDASVALLFIIQFIDYIATHNMKEYLNEKSFSY